MNHQDVGHFLAVHKGASPCGQLRLDGVLHAVHRDRKGRGLFLVPENSDTYGLVEEPAERHGPLSVMEQSRIRLAVRDERVVWWRLEAEDAPPVRLTPEREPAPGPEPTMAGFLDEAERSPSRRRMERPSGGRREEDVDHQGEPRGVRLLQRAIFKKAFAAGWDAAQASGYSDDSGFDEALERALKNHLT